MKIVKYATAFVAGYVGALLPVVARGDLPDRHALIAAIAAGVLATHLLDLESPRKKEGS
jgi:VIT1/CCC1 family predicted Fe2+/Mn2+ transporter